jgi:alginate O-acetyltransferase complex protein AlgI
MTLSAWFRNYLFFPLERRNKGRGKGRQILNILAVFFLTGLWHGVTPNYVAWGLWHGAAIALEQTRFGVWLTNRAGRPVQHLYTLGVVFSGWILFRTPSLAAAGVYFKSLLGFSSASGVLLYSVMRPVPAHVWLALGLGAILATQLVPKTGAWILGGAKTGPRPALIQGMTDVWLLAVLVVSIIVMAASSYQAYIYMKF